MRTTTSSPISATTPAEIGDAYRSVLGKFCTGVVAVTALDGNNNPVGMTVGSFSSVSLDPALVAFFVGCNSTTFPKVAASGRFCANILSANQHELGLAFARSGTDRFQGVDWTPARTGSPRLAGAHAWIDCDIDLIQTVGDHDLVVGRVVELGASDDRDPLVFYTSTFHQLNQASPA